MGEDVLPENRLVRKSCYSQKIWILTITQWVGIKASIAIKQYQRFDDKEPTIKDDKEAIIKIHNKSNLIYNQKFTFYRYV